MPPRRSAKELDLFRQKVRDTIEKNARILAEKKKKTQQAAKKKKAPEQADTTDKMSISEDESSRKSTPKKPGKLTPKKAEKVKKTAARKAALKQKLGADKAMEEDELSEEDNKADEVALALSEEDDDESSMSVMKKRKSSASSKTHAAKGKTKKSTAAKTSLPYDESDQDTILETSDDDDGNKKPAARAKSHKGEQPAQLRAALIEAEDRLARSQRQARTISKTQITNTFVEGRVRTWTKETLWRKCKFITNDQTMQKVMQLASEHFQVPEDEQQHWMATFSHVVRNGLNQNRNACTQDLRKSIVSKCHNVLQQIGKRHD